MPIFTYKCVNGHEFDVLEKYKDEIDRICIDRRCPECAAPSDRQLSAPNFTLKKGPYGEFL